MRANDQAARLVGAAEIVAVDVNPQSSGGKQGEVERSVIVYE